jgi:Zinc finger, ZZ type
MGSGASTQQDGHKSSSSYLFSTYRSQRVDLRRNLILATIGDPSNRDVLDKISTVRKLLTVHQHICATAAREALNEFDYSPTSTESAWRELERLYAIYETGRILKSAACRIGNNACPIGHYMGPFDKQHPTGQLPECNICNVKKISSGYHCSYCNYNLCLSCSVIYCDYGHPMVLWTNAESALSCHACKATKISGGYRCLQCDDVDICDMCTYEEGRQLVQDMIHARMASDLKYLEDHVTESATADRVSSTHRAKVANRLYPTTLALYKFSEELKIFKDIAVDEVCLTRRMKEINRLRKLVSVGVEHSATASRESVKDRVYTVKELDIALQEINRLTAMVAADEWAKSLRRRCGAVVACPLSHALAKFEGIPEVYRKEGASLPPYCKVCSRLAPEGYHCSLCEYDLCMTCSVVFCIEGHPMKMWTIPDAAPETMCYICEQTHLTTGYYCTECIINTCDICTARKGRESIREKWVAELNDAIDYMNENHRWSDVAYHYHWRHKSYVVSQGLLCEYVRELRLAKIRATKQVKYRKIIEQIKKARVELEQNPEICEMAMTESLRDRNYYYMSRREATAELKRIQARIQLGNELKFVDVRAKYGIACPIGHGMVPLLLASPTGAGADNDASSKNDKFDDDDDLSASRHEDLVAMSLPPPSVAGSVPLREDLVPADESSLPSPRSIARSQPYSHSNLRSKTPKQALHQVVEIDSNGHVFKSIKTPCRVCLCASTRGGHTCLYCNYDICLECSTIYCRVGHPMKLWTMYEAKFLECNVCRSTGITSGYRCLQCDTDICDMCTLKDGRDAMKLWPVIELKKLVTFLESIQHQSHIAKRFFLRYQMDTEKRYKRAMSSLCAELAVYQEAKRASEAEILANQTHYDHYMYGRAGKDA